MNNTYGIICYRQTKQGYEVLLVQRACSYAYKEFVRSPYIPTKQTDKDLKHLRELFSYMTIREKAIISTLDYDYMWVYGWGYSGKFLLTSDERGKFDEHSEIFISNYVKDVYGCNLLREAIITSMHLSPSLLYEFPKGRLESDEKPIQAALREFKEETNINLEKNAIISTSPIKYEFIGYDDKQKYLVMYYIAECANFEQTTINVTNLKYGLEISDILWVSIDKIPEKYLNIKQIIISSIVTHNLPKNFHKSLSVTPSYQFEQY